jgi:hypothetical protein
VCRCCVQVQVQVHHGLSSLRRCVLLPLCCCPCAPHQVRVACWPAGSAGPHMTRTVLGASVAADQLAPPAAAAAALQDDVINNSFNVYRGGLIRGQRRGQLADHARDGTQPQRSSLPGACLARQCFCEPARACGTSRSKCTAPQHRPHGMHAAGRLVCLAPARCMHACLTALPPAAAYIYLYGQEAQLKLVRPCCMLCT